uniref:Tubby C-terminal domain-containing protein n=1 Tax=Heterosigma akashiwo TaxID=2829 RepID=A0A7S3Y106_HETAK
MAVLQSNFLGTRFSLDDTGLTLAAFARATAPEEALRAELAAVLYDPNFFGRQGPRRMKVGLPPLGADGTPRPRRPRARAEEMARRLARGDKRHLWAFQNKPPVWAESLGAYVLNFDRRVSMASVKNFQLVAETDWSETHLQFGRFGRDLFSMDFAWPLSPVQAFGISLSSLDKKLGCD